MPDPACTEATTRPRTHRATAIPGDGVGPEVVASARRALDATGVVIDWDEVDLGPAAERGDDPIPERALVSIRGTGVALKGPLETPVGAIRNANVELRIALDLYAGVRRCRSFPGIATRYGDLDVVIVRENTEAEYTGVEFEHGEPETAEMIAFIEASTGKRVRNDSGLSIRTISEGASERIVRFAFAYAAEHGRSKVTVGHKANIMKFTDGVFLDAARRVAAEHPEISFEERIIDALAMQLVQHPEAFDVLVLPNLYGDIVSEVCAGFVGGPGFVPAVNLGEGVAVFETLHGSARHARGQATPAAMLLSAAMLLRHLGEDLAGDRLETAVVMEIDASAGDPERLATEPFTDAVLARLDA
jgi:isocitrate dehydrogenase (NAD+)